MSSVLSFEDFKKAVWAVFGGKNKKRTYRFSNHGEDYYSAVPNFEKPYVYYFPRREEEGRHWEVSLSQFWVYGTTLVEAKEAFEALKAST